MYTKDNPGCYHSMIQYLSQLSGIPQKEEVILPYNEVFKKTKSGNVKLQYPSYNVSYVINGKSCGFLYKQMRKGGVAVLTDGIVDYPYNVDIDRFIVQRYRKLDDFGVSYQKIGKYKDCLGNGYYQMVDLYQINDQFFAMMDCSC